MDFEFLFAPFEHLDSWIGGSLDGAPLVVALVLALALGLRHDSDPDHLVAVTSLMTADAERVGTAEAAHLGAWWGKSRLEPVGWPGWRRRSRGSARGGRSTRCPGGS